MSASSSSSYFEEQCKKYISAPFQSDAERRVFECSLRDWRQGREQLLRDAELGVASISSGTVNISSIPTLSQEGIDSKLSIWRGDVCRLEVDAVVNAANESLLGGGGIDEAIHNAAGPLLVRECATLGGCPIGQVKITKGYQLPALFVLHASGPVFFDQPRDESIRLLENCYLSALDLCIEYQIRTVAFPCISCGFYGFPLELAAETALRAVRKWLCEHQQDSSQIDRVIFCVYTRQQEKAYLRASTS